MNFLDPVFTIFNFAPRSAAQTPFYVVGVGGFPTPTARTFEISISISIGGHVGGDPRGPLHA